MALEKGTVIHLTGKTVRGKNRINRGGVTWMVVEVVGNRLRVESLTKKKKEMFWMQDNGDPHMRKLNQI